MVKVRSHAPMFDHAWTYNWSVMRALVQVRDRRNCADVIVLVGVDVGPVFAAVGIGAVAPSVAGRGSAPESDPTAAAASLKPIDEALTGAAASGVRMTRASTLVATGQVIGC